MRHDMMREQGTHTKLASHYTQGTLSNKVLSHTREHSACAKCARCGVLFRIGGRRATSVKYLLNCSTIVDTRKRLTKACILSSHARKTVCCSQCSTWSCKFHRSFLSHPKLYIYICSTRTFLLSLQCKPVRSPIFLTATFFVASGSGVDPFL